jgi:membrane protease YdiL (CAAX protease family)
VPLGWISFYAFWISLGIVSMVIPPLNAAMWSMGDTAAHRQTTATIQATPAFLLIAMMVANGFAEELVTKAYLIPRLRELLGGTWVAILLSAALFGSYHVYQGWIAAAGVCFSQILMGWLFTKIGRIWPFALGHALYDLVLVVMHR